MQNNMTSYQNTNMKAGKAGLPINAAQFFLHSSTQLEYHMVTSCGVSDSGVIHSSAQPIYRLDQGTTDAPPNWTLISN
eukprot:12907759-Ditylum_brightwellii.AAC.1